MQFVYRPIVCMHRRRFVSKLPFPLPFPGFPLFPFIPLFPLNPATVLSHRGAGRARADKVFCVYYPWDIAAEC